MLRRLEAMFGGCTFKRSPLRQSIETLHRDAQHNDYERNIKSFHKSLEYFLEHLPNSRHARSRWGRMLLTA